jgi:hypothetical protein
LFQWGSTVSSRVKGFAEILTLPVQLVLAVSALRFAQEDGKDEKEGTKRDRFFRLICRFDLLIPPALNCGKDLPSQGEEREPHEAICTAQESNLKPSD